ncbi:MAG: hypothetical protein ACI3Y5_02145 [Prevotella sp.]
MAINGHGCANESRDTYVYRLEEDGGETARGTDTTFDSPISIEPGVGSEHFHYEFSRDKVPIQRDRKKKVHDH